MQNKILFCTISVYCCLVSLIYAQVKFPPEKDRVGNEYYEGYRRYKNVSSGEIKLRAFIAKNSKVVDNKSVYYKIGFFITNELINKNIDIFVEDKTDKFYYMMPIRKKWNYGVNVFEWKNTKALKQNIQLTELFGLARSQGFDFTQPIIPIIFFNTRHSLSIESYEFVFIATRTANLRYTIYDELQNEIISGVLQNQLKNRNIIIEWNCKEYKEGKYILNIEYMLKNGKIVSGNNLYEFYHTHKLTN